MRHMCSLWQKTLKWDSLHGPDWECLKGVAITDEEFDRILLEPVGDFGNLNYIIRGFKKGN